MGVKIRNRNGWLYIDVIQNRKHKQEALHIKLSTDTQTAKEQMQLAEIIRAKRELQLARNEYNEMDITAGKTLLVVYMEKMTQGRDPRSPFVRTFNWLKKYKDGGNIKISAVNIQWVQDFEQWLLGQKELGQNTVSHFVTCMRQVFNHAVKNRVITYSPYDTVKSIQRTEVKKEILTREEIRILANTPINGDLGQELKRAFLFACMTGLRIGDIGGAERTQGKGALLWEHIEIRDITDTNKCKYWIIKNQNKTDNFVSIPLNKTAIDLISPLNFFQKEKPLFERLTKSNTSSNKYISQWVKSAGIEKHITMHNARHTFISLTHGISRSEVVAGNLAGHKKSSITQGYIHDELERTETVLKLDDILQGAEYLKAVAGGER